MALVEFLAQHLGLFFDLFRGIAGLCLFALDGLEKVFVRADLEVDLRTGENGVHAFFVDFARELHVGSELQASGGLPGFGDELFDARHVSAYGFHRLTVDGVRVGVADFRIGDPNGLDDRAFAGLPDALSAKSVQIGQIRLFVRPEIGPRFGILGKRRRNRRRCAKDRNERVNESTLDEV